MISKKELTNWVKKREYGCYSISSFKQWYENVIEDYRELAKSAILSDMKSDNEKNVLIDYYFNLFTNPYELGSFRLNMMFIHDLNIVIICDDIDKLELELDIFNLYYSDSWDAINHFRQTTKRSS